MRKSVKIGIMLQQWEKLIISGAAALAAIGLVAVAHFSTWSYDFKLGVYAAAVTVVGLGVITLLPKYKWCAAVVLLALITPLAIGGFWFSLDRWGISDWDLYFSHHENLRTIILHDHQLPLWNPYTCGGTAGLAEPESPLFTPTFALELMLGVPNGLRLSIFLFTIVGGVGMLLLSKKLKLSVEAALLTALLFMFCSHPLLQAVEGHVNIFANMWIPWTFWAWLGSYRRQMKPVWCGLFLALTFYQGGIFILTYTAIAFAILPLLTRERLRAYTVSILAGLWALGFAALKLIPALYWLKQFPKEQYASPTYTLPYIYQILAGRYLHGANVLPNQGTGWHEYGAYIGPFALALAALGVWAGRRKRLTYILVGTAVLAILLSSTGPLTKPLFDHATFLPRSNLSRVVFYAVIPLSILAGYSIDWLKRWKTVGHVLAILLIGTVAVDVMTLAYALSLQAFVIPPAVPLPQPATPPVEFSAFTYKTRYQGDDYNRTYAATLTGYGEISYCPPLTPPVSVKTIHDEGRPHPMAEVLDSGGQVAHIAWSPNQVVVSGTALHPARVALNTNFAKGWLANGTPALEASGRVSAGVPTGPFQLTFKFSPQGLFLGLVVTIGTLLLWVIWFVRTVRG